MGFQQGLSGLNVYSKALDVVSNNIANASTVGFKAAEAHFADMYAGAMNGMVSNKQIGIGVNLIAVQQQFAQGNISTTGNALDIAINGGGFFRLQKSPDDMSGYYSRNGQFHMNESGYIVNSNGCYLTGYASIDGVSVNTASIVPLTVGSGSIPAEQTGWSTRYDASKGGLDIGVNLDSRDKKAVTLTATPPDPEWTQLETFAWDNTFNSNMYNFSTSAEIFDRAGTAHILTNYYVRQGDSGTAARDWQVYTVIDNKYLVTDNTGAPLAQTMSFDANGTLDPTTDTTGNNYRFPMDLAYAIAKDGTQVDMTSDTPTAPATVSYNWFDQTPGYAFHMDLSHTTQFGLKFNSDSIIQDGYTAGFMTQLNVDEHGYVMAGYSNGKTKIMGQVLLAEFKNPNGLQSIGDNMWIETWSSGQPTLGEPQGGTRGKLQSGSVEDSNTDLTEELVNMIIMQRNYQANAQTIRTQDQILQTLVNLR
jgi:flagellar hook protein FlgE